MINIFADRGTQMDVKTAIFQLETFVNSIAAEAEVQKNMPGVQADVERFTANAAYYVQGIIGEAAYMRDPMRHIIIQLHRDITAANSGIEIGNWLRGKSEAETRDADARIMVFMLVLRKARVLAGLCGALLKSDKAQKVD